MKIELEVNLERIRQNLHNHFGKKVIFMVKADAYGHGLQQVALSVDDFVHGFGVATIEEGVALRDAGARSKILVAQWLPDEVDRADMYDLTLSVGDFCQLDTVTKWGLKGEVKVNTGMNRFGFDEDSLPTLKKKMTGMSPSGVYSHIYSKQSKLSQERCFQNAVNHLDFDSETHLHSSKYVDEKCGDVVRVGIGGYLGAMTVTSTVVAVRHLSKGDNVGYGNVMPKDGYIAWVFGGYGDGVTFGQPAVIDRRLCPFLSLCMDTFAVYVGDIPVAVGDKVLLQGDCLHETYLSKTMSVTPYQLMTRWKGRCERTYKC